MKKAAETPSSRDSTDCPRCGYDLSGSPSHVCSECGFDLESESAARIRGTSRVVLRLTSALTVCLAIAVAGQLCFCVFVAVGPLRGYFGFGVGWNRACQWCSWLAGNASSAIVLLAAVLVRDPAGVRPAYWRIVRALAVLIVASIAGWIVYYRHSLELKWLIQPSGNSWTPLWWVEELFTWLRNRYALNYAAWAELWWLGVLVVFVAWSVPHTDAMRLRAWVPESDGRTGWAALVVWVSILGFGITVTRFATPVFKIASFALHLACLIGCTWCIVQSRARHRRARAAKSYPE